MTTPLRGSRAAVAVALGLLVGLGVGACGGDDDISRDEFTTELRNQSGLSEAQATCVTDDIYDRLDQDDIGEIYGYTGDPDDEVGTEAVEALTDAITTCVGEGDAGTPGG